MKNELMQAHRALCSDFVDEDLFRRTFGSNRADLRTIAAYLSVPAARRPPVSLYFDQAYYLARNPDLRAAGIDPLVHFIETGVAETRSPHPLIDLQFVITRDPHVLGTPPDIAALVELLELDLANPSPYFDTSYYLAEIGGSHPPGGLLRHFLTVGLGQGKNPNPWLDLAWYRATFDDVPRDPYGALRHFVLAGDAESRPAGPRFDGAAYRARYQDVADARVPPLLHFLAHGREEGRQASNDRVRRAEAAAASELRVAQPLPFDPEASLRRRAEMRERLAQARQERKDAVRVKPPTLHVAEDAQAELAKLAFPAVAGPRVSIVLPVFNEFAITAECLMALRAAMPATPFEIVVADDASTDPDMRRLADVPGLVYLREPLNNGFIRTCNAAFARCRGEYVLLLNNDTQPLPGAIDRLVEALDADPAVGAAGAKLLYPNGRLQEAGCFIRPNGETGMVGLFDDPRVAGYCRDRDVAYCSGAALMVRRALAGATLFDEIFVPAYCEDVDLCLRLIAAGYRIRYVADAQVVHHLSVSTNRQSVTRKLRTIMRNQQTLLGRWGESLGAMAAVRLIAFYLPQYHPTPENDLWWGAGFTEWTNVAKAQPSYLGHYQPHLPADLGFYDLRSSAALEQQARLATRYGVEGFCVYYYNFGKRRVLSRPLDIVRADPTIPFRWCLCWANENWTKHWDGGSKEVLLEQSYDAATLHAIIVDAVADARDPRYLRVGERPLFLVYRPMLLPDPAGFARDCRTAFAAAGFAGVHLVYVESMEAVDLGIRPADLGFDACVEFPPHGRAVASTREVEILKDGWSGYRYDYAATALAFVNRDPVPYTRYPAVFPSWDNTPRQPLKGTSFEAASPEAFQLYVEEKIDEARAFLMGEERLVFINAWNEWAEGAHLEPDTGYGHRWLEALRDAIAAKNCA